MKTPKIIHYKIPVSQTFLSDHPRAGQETYFVEKIINNPSIWQGSESTRLFSVAEFGLKLHTIRGNYPEWVKRIAKVHAGKAVIDLCYWTLPGGRFTKGNELIPFATLDKDSGCGVQELNFIAYNIERPCIFGAGYASRNHLSEVSKNDGLTYEDFKAWFRKYDLSHPMAIIHFTKFRY